MVGYGAFLMALSQPEIYAAAASLSGILDIHERVRKNVDARSENMIRLSMRAAERRISSSVEIAILWRMRKKIGLSLDYEEHPGADHEWAYWDRQIQRVIEWLPTKGGR